MNKINLSFVISNLGPGGAERQFVELIKNIDKSKFTVSLCLYAANKGLFFSDLENDANVKIEKNLLNKKIKPLKILEALFYLRRYFLNNEFDIVLTTLFMNGLFVRLAAPSKYKDRIISTIRNALVIYKKRHLFLERILLKNSFVVVNTRRAEKEFQSIVPKKYKNRISSIYNGFDLSRFYSTKNRDGNKLIIGNVGRQTCQKNQIQLIKVSSTLKNINFQLQIVGSSGDQSKLLNESIIRNILDQKVKIIDNVTNIEEYYRNFDIFILSSHHEGCPNVLFEAMLSKCFCIVSRSANTDDFVTDGENGLVYNGTDEDLENKLRYAIQIKHTEAFDTIRENGFKYAKENFSMDKMVKSYEKLFIDILNKYHDYNNNSREK
ncbi:MAG: glycosyltransferase [Stygiobacter sp.]|nr:MAG: glycosyltransferase [Stygiobacter sp.]